LAAPHVRPPQQSPVPLHGFETAEQPHFVVAVLHLPVQQSAAVAQLSPSAMQPHVFAELQNGLTPQQSAAVAQACPEFEQPHFDVAALQR
jgi:hypothetical protein